jgi:hypothetical protein
MKLLMTLHNGHSIGKTWNWDFLRLPNVFFKIQIIFHLFHLNEFQGENVTCNNFRLPFVMCNVVFFQNHNPYSSTSSNNPSLNIIHLIWNISYIISIIIFMFFFSISWCCSSGDEFFFSVNVCQNAIFFYVGTPRKVFWIFICQKKGYLNWVH